MQQIIGQILEGSFDYEKGSLDFSCAKIELSIKKGEWQEGAFHIYAPSGLFTNGMVSSSDWRMECLTQEFSGEDEEILYRFHGETLEEGDVVKGCFNVVSNRGEYYLPFVATVEYAVAESSVGRIKNLFHFANLAKNHWQEALKLFYSPEFASVLTGSDAQYQEDYRALCAYPGHEQNMEEFLIQVNKKQRAEFLTEEEELYVEADGQEVTESVLTVARSGWGYTRLYIQCQGDFLFTEKEMLTEDDFLGNRCRLPIFVDGRALHRGKNLGQICLYNSYVSLWVPVTVQLGKADMGNGWRLDKKRCVFRLMVSYQAFRMRKIGTSTWLKETGKLVERMVAEDEDDIAARLFQAQLLITEERIHEAGWILDHVSELLEERPSEDALLAYYLYLTTLVHNEEAYIRRVSADVEKLYRRNDSNWRVAWLLLYLSEDYYRSEKNKWALLEKLFREGCTSPVLYIEALTMLNANPALLRSLEGLGLQTLYYGARQGIVRQELRDQAVYQAGKVKEYSQLLFRTLEKLYETGEDQGLLREICALLIKGGRTEERYSHWYRAGVDAQLRLTNLYEYYMMSLNLEEVQELPKAVLLYFSYQNSLDYARCAYLYDYILQRKDRMGDIYEANRQRMELFVATQIRKGRMDRHLANLYNRLLRPGMVDEQTCRPFSRLLFAHMVQVEDDRLRKVYVYQPGNLRPAEYALWGRKAWISLYGSRYTIVFEDAWKNRFVKSVEYTLEKLMIPGKYLRWLLAFKDVAPELDLYLCDKESGHMGDGREDIERALRVAGSDYADNSVKRELYLRILWYYYENDNLRAMDKYLEKIPVEELGAKERGEVFRHLVLRGNYELAEQWLVGYGPYFMDVKVLVRLLGALIERRNKTEDPLLLAAAEYAFRRGKYDSVVLEYLVLYYKGMTRSMRDIWKAARSFDMDCYRLCERILVQMLYSGAFVGEKMDIFRYYISQGAKLEVEEAFLAQCAFDYFVKERMTEQEVFGEIRNMQLRGEPVQKVCKLAFLKYFAENPEELEESHKPLLEQFLEEMTDEGIYLEFFREFQENRDLRQELLDKTILEYRSEAGAKARIHYTVLHENGQEEGYLSEYMQDAYGGVCFKTFVLFFGESIQYYITEERDGEEQLTESGTLQRRDDGGSGEESRYKLINDIVMSRSLEDFDTLDDLLEEYYRKDFLNGRLFVLE